MATIEKHEDDLARNVALVDFLNKINDSSDLHEISRHIVRASKALGQCAGANFYTVEAVMDKHTSGPRKLDSCFESGEQFLTHVRMGTEIHDKMFSIDKGIPGEVHRRGLPVLVNAPTASPFFDHQVDEPRDGGACRNALGIPIFSKSDPSKVVAVLVLFNAFVKTDSGWSDRAFELEDADRFHFFALWIAIFLSRPKAIQVPVDAIAKILRNQAWQHQPEDSGSRDLEKLHRVPHLGMHSLEVPAWHAISDTVKTATRCQAFAAFRLVSAETRELECLYPAAVAGHRLCANAGILKEVFACANICCSLSVWIPILFIRVRRS